MVKRNKNKTKAKAVKVMTKRKTKREARKNVGNKRNPVKKIYQVSKNKKNKVILPKDLLNMAKNKIPNKPTTSDFLESMKIYDIDDDINFRYLKSCGKITHENFKYIYTLSYNNRKKIIKQYDKNRKIFAKSSKVLFFELVNFLINKFKLNDNTSKKQLKQYNLENFENFIIPISEGTEELKYYYFMSIILDLFQKDPKNGKNCLTYFKNFFKKQKNRDKINHIFYIILRIYLLFFGKKENEDNTLLDVKYMVDQDLKYIKKTLKLIKENIKENIDKIIIKNDTELTTKESGFKFKPIYYYFYPEMTGEINIMENIENKKWMTYDYCLNNRFNYFDDDKKVNAFFSFFKKILNSRVIREYYQKVESFKNYEFPLGNENIVNYLWGKIITTELDNNFSGICNREGFGIFINRAKGKKYIGLEYGKYIIIISHEVVGHYLRNLINSNAGLNAFTPSPNESFINHEDNIYVNNCECGGQKFEVLLFGESVPKITIILVIDLIDFSASFIKNGFGMIFFSAFLLINLALYFARKK